MRKTWTLALALLLLPSLARAQPEGEAVLWLAADGGGQASEFAVLPFTQFEIYAVVAGAEGISAIELSLNDPAGATILGQDYPVPGALNIGLADNPIVGFGQCVEAAGEPTWVVRTRYFWTLAYAGNDLLFCPGPASPSSVGGAGPAYVDCADQLFVLGSWDSTGSGGVYPESCAVGNPGIVANEASSWGRVKAGGP